MTSQPIPPPSTAVGAASDGAASPPQSAGDRSPAGGVPPRVPKEIATLPPLPVLRHDIPLSKRTGEPPRPWSALAALVLLCLASVAIAVGYARHWWLAVHPETYPSSAHLIQWVAPEPGKWLSLTLEGVLALVVVLVAGACAVAGYQTWIGWSWARVISATAVALTGVAVLLFDLWALAGVGLALLGTVAVFLPETARYFQHCAVHRARPEDTYRTPANIVYGRLPRFR